MSVVKAQGWVTYELMERVNMLEYYKFKTVYNLFLKGLEKEAKIQLTGLQRRYVALCDENTTLKIRIQELEDILFLAKNLFSDGQFYWLNTGTVKQGPFCPHCYDTKGVLMRLAGEWHEAYCPSCNFVSAGDKEAIMHEAMVGERISREPIAEPHAERVKRAKIISFTTKL